MSLYEMPNLTTGMDDSLVQIAGSVPTFFPAFLFFMFMIVFIGGATAQKRRTGYSDIPMWGVIASLSTLLLSLGMSIISGLIQLEVVAILVVITVLFGVWLFLDKRNTEI